MNISFISDKNDKYDVLDDALYCQSHVCSANKWGLMEYVHYRFYNKGCEIFDLFYEMVMSEMQDEFQQPKLIK